MDSATGAVSRKIDDTTCIIVDVDVLSLEDAAKKSVIELTVGGPSTPDIRRSAAA